MIYRLMHPLLACAIGAAVEGVVCFNTVADDLTTTVIAHRRQLLDRTLEAVEDVRLSRRDDLKGEMIIIAADFTLSHVRLLCNRSMEAGKL